jgi:hypothetical protein
MRYMKRLLNWLGLSADSVIHSDNDKALGEFSDGINDVGRFEIARFSLINVEDLDGVLDNLVEIHW